MKTNWLMAAGTAAALLAGSVAYAEDLSPAELDPLVKSGRVLPLDELQAAALATHHGGRVKSGEVERKNGGYIYEAEVTDHDGGDWDVDIDATTGLLLKDEKD
ncbi:MAG TPA: PepSY domain-containing protein [Rhodanobacteraceae bacterium]|nr:PepSY domain-containing protein [Rhodanobacteraceae bacterium]